MELELFRSEDHYLKAQRRARRNRCRTPYCASNEFEKLENNLSFIPEDILCHGAFKGEEVQQLQDLYPNASVIGTDLAPEGENVIEWDFRKFKQEWVGNFDLIYSNSLDHADNPEECLTVWFEQLSVIGTLAIQWTPSHREARGGDCFGAEFHEYLILINRVGNQVKHRGVTDVVYCEDCTLLILASKT